LDLQPFPAYKSVTNEKRRKFFIPPGIEDYTFAFMKPKRGLKDGKDAQQEKGLFPVPTTHGCKNTRVV
jgi:hypothetical protein